MSDFFEIDTNENIPKTYAPYELVSDADPILYKPTEEVDLTETAKIKEVCGRLIATAKRHKAFGVAANQCGLPYSIFVMGAEDDYISVINPKILIVSVKQVILEEACLSFPYLSISIKRPYDITVEFFDENLTKKELTFEGMSARIFQHEYNHLEGKTFIKKAKPLALKIAIKRREKMLKRIARRFVNQQNG